MRKMTSRLQPVLLSLLIAGAASAQDYKSLPFWNPDLSFEQRAADVVSRLTLEEKVAQMLNSAPAVPRLGIPGYDWWNEVLHGVARTPFRTTSYPQAIGMAATWDTLSLRTMAHYSATEGRAVHNRAIGLGRNHERYLGLTYWTPNINIFRDPRWGRGQETYGEDPFLTAMLGRAFVHGLQGDDPHYLHAAACAKHFAVHSGPEPSRHSDNFSPSLYDLWDTYLPAFEELITRADVAGVMCAYNAFEGQPCCASDLLMNDILRRQWKFNGYVTSDCWALDDFFRYHKTHTDAVSSAVDAVLHGTDVECGQSVYPTLLDAVRTGKLREEQLDVSLRRLFTIRLRLGIFDPVERVRYAQTPQTALEAPEHKAHALKMAQQSVVLLKNANNTLPLRKDIRKIAVLGPNADNSIAILGNYNGIPSKTVNALEGIRAKLGGKVEVHYEQAVGFTQDTLLRYADLSGQFHWAGQPGFQAEYFLNKELSGRPEARRMEHAIDNDWLEGQEIAGQVRALNFSARYVSNFTALADGDMMFELEGDDGYRFFVNDSLVVDAWQRNRWGAKTYKLAARKGNEYKFTIEFWQGEGPASLHLRVGHREKSDFEAVAQRVQDADVLVFVGGISPQLEGEEMPVAVPGFHGGDRTSILLPAVQTELLKALHKTGKPVVLVLMTGSAVAIPWENEHLPAIVNAWYGGQSAGAAIADVLFGDYNPAGRLPVTFYKSDADLPSFKSYDMSRRTYRYFQGEVQHPFGYGLSYTTFRYERLQAPQTLRPGQNATVSVTVTNTGKRDGEEVVQLYVSYPEVAGHKPVRALKGFQRIFLRAGESRTLSFQLSPRELELVNAEGKRYLPRAAVEISVGGGQPDMPQPTSGNVLKGIIRVED